MPHIPEAPGPKKIEKTAAERAQTGSQQFQALIETYRVFAKSERLQDLVKVARYQQDHLLKKEALPTNKEPFPTKTATPSKEIQKTLAGMSKLQALLQQAESEEKAGKDSSVLLKDLTSAVALLRNGNFDTKQLEHFATIIVQLNQHLPHLPPKLKTLVKQAFTDLATLKSHPQGSKQSVDLSLIVASILVSGWQRDYIASAKSPTKKGAKSAVQEKAKSVKLDANTPFLAKVAEAVKKMATSYPETNELGKPELSFDDPAFMNHLSGKVDLDDEKAGQVQTAIQTHSNKAAKLLPPLMDHTASVEKLSKSPTTRDIAYEISYLKKLIAVLLKYLGKDPALASQLKADLSALEKISKDYPHLTKADVEKLQKILKSANAMETKLPDAGKQEFIDIEIKMLQAMSSANKAEISKLEKELQSYQEVASLQKVLEQLRTLLDSMQSGASLSPSQMQQLLSDVNLLRRVLPTLPKGAQKYIKNILNQISGFSNTINVDGKKYTFNLANTMADVQFYNWIQEYKATAKNPTAAGLMAFLKQKIAEFSKGATGPTGEKMLKELEADLKGFPKPADGQGIINDFTDPNFLSNTRRVFSLHGTPISEMYHLNYELNQVSQFVTESAKTVANIEKNIAEYQALNAAYKKDINDLQIHHMWASSLQAGFASAILNHYMPGQESYLNQLAMLLFFSNFGANMDNEILSSIIGFSNANNDFNSSNWFGSRNLGKKMIYVKKYKTVGKRKIPYWTKETTTVYSGTPTQAQQEIKKEIEKANDDIAKAQKALEKITSQEEKIQNEVKDGKLTKAQGAKLTNELQGYRNNLTTAISNLKGLISTLKTLKIEPVFNKDGDPIPNEFQIAGSQSNPFMNTIQSDENTLVNGKASDGGLVQINSDITAAQKSWGSQSQTNQMQLQLVMTEIQQEWSIVSTAMSMLNQMYLTVARGIGGK